MAMVDYDAKEAKMNRLIVFALSLQAMFLGFLGFLVFWKPRRKKKTVWDRLKWLAQLRPW